MILSITEEQAEAVLQALDQFVENGNDFIESSDVPDPKIQQQVARATEVLDILNARKAAVGG